MALSFGSQMTMLDAKLSSNSQNLKSIMVFLQMMKLTSLQMQWCHLQYCSHGPYTFDCLESTSFIWEEWNRPRFNLCHCGLSNSVQELRTWSSLRWKLFMNKAKMTNSNTGLVNWNKMLYRDRRIYRMFEVYFVKFYLSDSMRKNKCIFRSVRVGSRSENSWEFSDIVVPQERK